MDDDMAPVLAATVFSLALLTGPAMAIEVGYDCAEGSDEDIVTPQQTPIPAPGS